MRSGGCSAGSSRVQRLDPFALPVRFAASDAAADERVRHVELHRERVVVRRSVAGIRMALNLPLSSFTGIGLQVMTSAHGAHCAVVLAHKDPGLVLPLFLSREADDALAEWRSWAAVLGLPMLLHDDDAGWREAHARMGRVRVGGPRPRRRRRSALKGRRPMILMRRLAGARDAAM
ncbi:MAG TPA: DUF6101 family protein, partial [Pseudolabrys sp.]|nr:DUF6101 family protein [Pseudolabrys sp.]